MDKSRPGKAATEESARKEVLPIQISIAPSIDGSRSTATSRKLDTPVSGGA